MLFISLFRRLLAGALFCALGMTSAVAAEVDLFSPEGSIKDIRQVVARFSDPMVALGDPRLPDPFEIDCAADGQGRWADGRNWVYDFDEDLPAGVVCKFSLKTEAKTLDGKALTGRRNFQFDTGGPAIRASLPRDGWQVVDSDQVFVLALDARPDLGSVKQHAYCSIKGIGERIPFDVVEGDLRRQILDQRRRTGYAYYSLLWKDGWQTQQRIRDRAVEKAEELVVVGKCRRSLPPDTQIALVWGKGIETATGVPTAQAQTLAFKVRPPFLAKVTCERTNARAACLPIRPIAVTFTAPVSRDKALEIRLEAPDGSVFAPRAIEETDMVQRIEFMGPFPPSVGLEVSIPGDITDDADRRLHNADLFPLEIRTDTLPALAKFPGTFGILELKQGGVMPLTLRNVESDMKSQIARQPVVTNALRVIEDDKAIASWIRRVQEAQRPSGRWEYDTEDPKKKSWVETTGSQSVFDKDDETRAFTIPKEHAADKLEVVGLPLKEPGFYVLEVASPLLGASLLGEDQVRYVATTALVTNMSVHFKSSSEGPMIWVTTLDKARPVAGAVVAVTDICTGELRWSGETDKNGLAKPDVGTSLVGGWDENCGRGPAPLMVSARTDDDVSFTMSNWSRGIRSYDFGIRSYQAVGPILAHTVTDRPLFRAGETVSMKHFLRTHHMDGMKSAVSSGRKLQVALMHQGSWEQKEFKVDFDENGTADHTWTIPEDAKLGTYAISIARSKDRYVNSGSFKVQQFRVPTMRAVVQGPAEPSVNPQNVQLDLFVAYQSGGGASGAPVKLRSAIEPKTVSFPDYGDYTFGGDPVAVESATREGGRSDYDSMDRAQTNGLETQILPLTLDAQGSSRVTVPVSVEPGRPAQLVAELEYADANGEILTTANRVPLWPSAVHVGIRPDGWMQTDDGLKFRVVVLDLKGKPISGQAVEVTLYQRKSFSFRKRLIGGFYDYDTTTTVERLDVDCEGTTDKKGFVFCDIAPGVSGEVLIRAETVDAAGNPAGATKSTWLLGDEDWWFGGTSSDRMDVLPEEKAYEPGDRARFQVRMPFRWATALVTVEREGVIDSFVTQLSGLNPVVEVPIKGSYAPNVFVSVLALRGRTGFFENLLADWARIVGDPSLAPLQDGGTPTGIIDLGKPAYRMGIAEIDVGWRKHRLDVRVEPEQEAYKVRKTAKVRISVAPASGDRLPAGAEVAIAAVDEGLLMLAPNRSWALLDAMMGKRGLDVETATAQMQVVGKRHFGQKAVPDGGGGGRERARELFDTLLLWKGKVSLDKDGKAVVEVPLNESLTAFRIVAVAHAGAELFGTGSATIRTTKDLMVHSGAPPLVREDDRYDAIFTVRNTTDAVMDVIATAEVAGLGLSLPEQRLTIPSGESREAVWPVAAPVGESALEWDIAVRDETSGASDRIRIQQSVIPAVPVRTYSATISRADPTVTIPAARPADAIPGRGGLELTLMPSLAGSLDGVREFMQRYTYRCIEQLASRAVALRNPRLWDSAMQRLSTFQSPSGLLRFFQNEGLPGNDALTAYVLAIAHEAGWDVPAGERQAMIGALTDFVAGRIIVDSPLPTADLTIRKLAAIEALSRYAAADTAMLDSIVIEPNLWPTSAVLDWLNILARLPDIENSQARSREAKAVLRARLSFQGTAMGFATERSDALWWLMVSGDSNAVRALSALMDDASWKDDVPRLVRGALGRQQFGHWNTTVANAWGVLALEKFGRLFEAEKVGGTTTIDYGRQSSAAAWPDGRPSEDIEQSLAWEEGATDLTVDHAGSGSPWLMVRARAALPLKEALSTGFKIDRSVIAVEQKVEGKWSRGDVARIRLEIEAQSDMTWVVVDDPIPGGATVLGSGLGGQSGLLTRGEQREGYVWSAYEERRQSGFIAYYRFVPKGRWVVEYTVRLNNPGRFSLPPTRVEAMYAPEMFGELPNDAVTVEATP
ncbi:MAG: alpha-2-macroglobulin family protein [Alphaproteobacteria bacterium]